MMNEVGERERVRGGLRMMAEVDAEVSLRRRGGGLGRRAKMEFCVWGDQRNQHSSSGLFLRM